MDKTLRKDIIDFLLPLPAMQSERTRRATLYAAGLDVVATQADLGGGSREAVTTIVYALEQHGTIGGIPALVVFLEELAGQVGEDKQQHIREFCAQLSAPTSAPKPAPAPQSTPSGGIHIGTVHGDAQITQVGGDLHGDITGRDRRVAPQITNVSGDYFENVSGNARIFTGPVTMTNDNRQYNTSPQPAPPPPQPQRTQSETVDIELSLHRRETEGYQVELRIDLPGSQRIDHIGPFALQIPFDELRALELDPEGYGALLGQHLFSVPAVRERFFAERHVAEDRQRKLRFRLFIAQNATELHDLRWETLRDPISTRCLLTDEGLLFSRYLGSARRQPEALQLPGRPRALVMVANPSDLAEYGMPALDVAGEIEWAETALQDVSVTALASRGQARLDMLIERLREGCDLLYLSAHGRLVENEPWLWLEQESGSTARVSGNELVTRLRDLARPPRLIVLSSCQSAGTGESPDDARALAALGPRLVAAGIPAVVAMQGNISIGTAEKFMPVFFRELRRDGLIDRAMAVARGMVRNQPDWYMPVLFMHLKDGRLWEVG